MQEVRFSDIELVVVNHVRSRLAAVGDTAAVGTLVPAARPARFVTVRRTGGPVTALRVTEWAQVTLEVWGSSPKQASDLAQLVRGFVNSMSGGTFGGTTVYGVQEFSGPANLPDPESNQARYTWTVSMHVRAGIVVEIGS